MVNIQALIDAGIRPGDVILRSGTTRRAPKAKSTEAGNQVAALWVLFRPPF